MHFRFPPSSPPKSMSKTNNSVLFAGICRRDFLKKISDSSSSGLKVVAAVHRKGEKIHQWNIQQNDGAKYMSYIKVVWRHIQLYLLTPLVVWNFGKMVLLSILY